MKRKRARRRVRRLGVIVRRARGVRHADEECQRLERIAELLREKAAKAGGFHNLGREEKRAAAFYIQQFEERCK